MDYVQKRCVVHSLQTNPVYNGQIVTITARQEASGRYVALLEGDQHLGKTLSLKAGNLHAIGDTVFLHDLRTQQHLNGKHGYIVVATTPPSSTRTAVYLPAIQQIISVKSENFSNTTQNTLSDLPNPPTPQPLRGMCTVYTWEGGMPKGVNGLKGMYIVDIACGFAHYGVVTGKDEVFMWGSNEQNQTNPYNTTSFFAEPVRIDIGPSIAISCGAAHTVVLLKEGTLCAWGANAQGQLGGFSKGVVQIKIPVKIVAVTSGIGHTIALDEDGDIWGWGWNNQGQLGSGSRNNVVRPIKLFEGVIYVRCGGGHTMLVDMDHKVWGSGSNACGQIGNNNFDNLVRFEESCTLNTLGHRIVSVSCGEEYSIAISENHSVFSTGLNIVGQLGTDESFGAFRSVFKQIPISAEHKPEFISGSQQQVLCTTQSGAVLSWGGETTNPTIFPSLSRKRISRLIPSRRGYCALCEGLSPKHTVVRFFLKNDSNELSSTFTASAGAVLHGDITTYYEDASSYPKGGEEVSIVVRLLSDTDEVVLEGVFDVTDSFDGVYEICDARFKHCGRYLIEVVILQEVCRAMVLNVVPDVVSTKESEVEMWAPFEISGEIPAGTAIFLTFTLRDRYGNEICVDTTKSEGIHLTFPNGTFSAIFRTITNNAVSLAVKIYETGDYDNIITWWDGHDASNLYSRHEMHNIFSQHRFSVIGGPAVVGTISVSTNIARIGEKIYFKITARDAHGNVTAPQGLQTEAVLQCISDSTKSLLCVLEDEVEGERCTEMWSFTPVVAGDFSLAVVSGGTHLEGSPFALEVVLSEEGVISLMGLLVEKEVSGRRVVVREAGREYQSVMDEAVQALRVCEEAEEKVQRAARTQRRAEAAAKIERSRRATEQRQLATQRKAKRTGGGFAVKFAWGEPEEEDHEKGSTL